ncbi:single-stranded DNA-binding protein [Acidiferrimicrobium sp. IK]|uniref:single-stranded DNA-binding protein n=1 Tax=Acidiferrimicrobium sp. IK TaxID=2871700 RepID=UPI0021CB3A1D|nr:single-stranded DNA-binding protein [Acidiferrimicrobium sp. IK]MCU4187116.1 single-stranded DNA-binding protein [Acidiferrimicrobium sp. IK]
MATNSAVTIVGNLTRDPELRFTPSGQATASFGVAVNRRWQNRQTQEWNEATSFFDVVCWAELAENAAQSLTRGTRVVVSGRLDQRSWENQDGEKRSKIEIVADEVAPSLRYATAQISRNERRGPDGGAQQSGGGYSSGAQQSGGGYNSGAQQSGGGYNSGGSAPAPRPAGNEAPQGDYQYEEEPF